MRTVRLASLVAVSLMALAISLPAQRPSFYRADPWQMQNPRYDGRFALARISYTTGPGGYYYRGLPAWAHGFPQAERNLMQILNAISIVHPHIDQHVVVALDDPELLKYPVSYMTEAGFWVMSDREALDFRTYLQKGGFTIFDDFRPPPRGGGGWENFEANMDRVIPGARFVQLDPSNTPFHTFFDISSFEIIPQYYDFGRPEILGLYQDNDPTRRLLAVVNFWEFSGTGMTPVDESNEAYELGVDYIIYGLTH